jgi:hypothetical protein
MTDAQLSCRSPINDHCWVGSTVAILQREPSINRMVLAHLPSLELRGFSPLSPEKRLNAQMCYSHNGAQALLLRHVRAITTYDLMTWRRKQEEGSHGRGYSPRSTAAGVTVLYSKAWALAVPIMINICVGEVTPICCTSDRLKGSRRGVTGPDNTSLVS